jgi:hypothetical protein
MCEESSKETFIVFYDGVDGPTIRIDIYEADYLSALLAGIKDLIDGRKQKIDISEMIPVKMINLQTIVMEIVPESEVWRKSVFLKKDKSEITFLWITSSEGWLQCYGLIEGLVVPGHQYLNTDAHDDAVIEIAYQENRPSGYQY